jgi:hypothetical protein
MCEAKIFYFGPFIWFFFFKKKNVFFFIIMSFILHFFIFLKLKYKAKVGPKLGKIVRFYHPFLFLLLLLLIFFF